MTSSKMPNPVDQANLREWLGEQSRKLGFDGLRITDTHLGVATERLNEWLEEGRHGQMQYMARHAQLRSDPGLLVPGTVRVICVTMNYLSPEIDFDAEWQRLAESTQAVVSMYARGRDYHNVMRNRLQEFAQIIEQQIGSFGYRVFTDSAPLMEVELARKAGLGWRGKHTLLLNRESGSTFFLGEILVDVPLPVDQEEESHCGTCQSCIEICPTQAITAPYQLDARRCISYLTIENPDAIPAEFRRAMGNRVYGCDDCQLICPWTEDQFGKRHEGSAIRRIGYSRWRRNLAVALGNALADPNLPDADKNLIRETLINSLPGADALVAEHIEWALSAG